MAQVMMLTQVTLEPSILRILGANHLDLQRPQAGQARLDPSRGRTLKQVRTRIQTARAGGSPTFGQHNESSLVELEQQGPRGHVLELARGGVPLPALRQGLRHAPS